MIIFILQGVLGTILCLGTKNKGPIPINKNLWYMCNFHAILDSRISMMCVCIQCYTLVYAVEPGHAVVREM